MHSAAASCTRRQGVDGGGQRVSEHFVQGAWAQACQGLLANAASSSCNLNPISSTPGARASTAAGSASRSAPSSSLTAMRSAWKVRVAGWMPFRPLPPPVSMRWIVSVADTHIASLQRILNRGAAA
jgi:hypothetical protein